MYAASARSSAPRTRTRKRRLKIWIVADVRCNVANCGCKYSAKTLKKVEKHRQSVHNLRPNIYTFQSNSTTSFEPESLKDGGLDPTTSAKFKNVKCKLCTKSDESETMDTVNTKSSRRRKRKRTELEKKEVEDDEEIGQGAGKAQGKKEVKKKEERKSKEEIEKIVKGQKAKPERERKKGKRRLNGKRKHEQENAGAMAESDTMDVDHDPAQASPTLKSKPVLKEPKQQLPLDPGSDQAKAAAFEESTKTSNLTLLPSPTPAPVIVQTDIKSPSPDKLSTSTQPTPKNLNFRSPNSQLPPTCANQSNIPNTFNFSHTSNPMPHTLLPPGGLAHGRGTLGGESPWLVLNQAQLGIEMVRRQEAVHAQS